jgi:hypothetical protein
MYTHLSIPLPLAVHFLQHAGFSEWVDRNIHGYEAVGGSMLVYFIFRNLRTVSQCLLICGASASGYGCQYVVHSRQNAALLTKKIVFPSTLLPTYTSQLIMTRI